MDNDGYEAVQVAGFGDKRENIVNKPMKDTLKAGVSQEIRQRIKIRRRIH